MSKDHALKLARDFIAQRFGPNEILQTINEALALPEALLIDIDSMIMEICELPNRTSPEDQPDMMLVTAEELRAILLAHAINVSAEDNPYDILHIDTLIKEWFVPYTGVSTTLISGLEVVLRARMQRLAGIIATREAAAREEERERAAQKAFDFVRPYEDAKHLAAVIRSHSE